MDWVQNFYAKQGDWSGCYTGDVLAYHHGNAALVQQNMGKPTGIILELGAGGGQNAVALAKLGYDVVAIELVSSAAAHAHHISQNSPIAIVEGDFYTVELNQQFDAVCYWDGFGIGTDDDQRRLLKRITHWLNPTGFALIDVYAPWYWADAAGRKMTFDNVSRQYDFDHAGQRMMDRWWPVGNEEAAVTQSLRCYAPDDLENLLVGTGLTLNSITSKDSWDAENRRLITDPPITQAMQYVAKITPSPTRT